MEEQATRAKAPWTNWRRASFHKQSKDLNSPRIARLQGSRSLISSRRDHLPPRPAAQFLQDVICRRRADDVVITAVDSTSLLSSLLLIVASRVLWRHIIILSDISSFSPRSACRANHSPSSPFPDALEGRVAGLDERVAGLDERASFGPGRRPPPELALGLLSSSAPSSAPSPSGDMSDSRRRFAPGRVDQRHSLLTSSATPTTVRPPPFPDALAARGELPISLCAHTLAGPDDPSTVLVVDVVAGGLLLYTTKIFWAPTSRRPWNDADGNIVEEGSSPPRIEGGPGEGGAFTRAASGARRAPTAADEAPYPSYDANDDPTMTAVRWTNDVSSDVTDDAMGLLALPMGTSTMVGSRGPPVKARGRRQTIAGLSVELLIPRVGARWASGGLQGGAWSQPAPPPARPFATVAHRLKPNLFRLALLSKLLLPVPEFAKAPKCKCGATFDIYGHHALSCPRNSKKGPHNMIRDGTQCFLCPALREANYMLPGDEIETEKEGICPSNCNIKPFDASFSPRLIHATSETLASAPPSPPLLLLPPLTRRLTFNNNYRPTPNDVTNGPNERSTKGAAALLTTPTFPSLTRRHPKTSANSTLGKSTEPTDSSSPFPSDPTARLRPDLPQLPFWPRASPAPVPVQGQTASQPRPPARHLPPRTLKRNKSRHFFGHSYTSPTPRLVCAAAWAAARDPLGLAARDRTTPGTRGLPTE
ncbi:hypothetical protein THAOC_13492 [Thalassiosira oceanica]|uniref:Uncharacterized protein n=1 Tax=Thalassiosira oceanica TaxID=159749 RepID=K0SL01_THAOC|nr:hypothetical protein THAOC_13492 [Thalassiosira oceanica]|eukprot:EJK65629.1 hypothetical protein THAOC_13492 [Thalassiosira oceanica]